MKFLFAIIAMGASFVSGAASAYKCAEIAPQHAALRQRLIESIRASDIAEMEKVCREGTALAPDDALWHYNLACALARRGAPDEALEELAAAVELGVRDTGRITADRDFKSIAADRRFAQIVERAKKLGKLPPPGQESKVPLKGVAGSSLTLAERNLEWNFEADAFEAKIELSDPPGAGPREAAARYNGPVKEKLARWLAEGTAAGNLGDLYMNRDAGHSRIATTNFPYLTSIGWEAAAKARNLDQFTPNALSTLPVFGNASLAIVKGFLWRSAGRINVTDSRAAMRMQRIYLNNQFWVFPAVKDFSAGATSRVDLILAAAPFHLLSAGASFSDRRFVNAALAASAAMRPETKRAAVNAHLLGPTLQWLFRRCHPSVKDPADYLAPDAHPTAFGVNDLNVDALVEKAHDLKPGELPPVAMLALANSRAAPLVYARAGVDYPDCAPEFVALTPFSNLIVLRRPVARREFIFCAAAAPGAPGAEFAWKVVHGPAAAVEISAPADDDDDAPRKGRALIRVDARLLVPGERVDVACFAKAPGTEWGAPSYISFSLPALAEVEWGADGHADSIDYSNPRGRYSDPLVSLPRRWKDVYRRDRNGNISGFDRYRDGEVVAKFAADGRRIAEEDSGGKPVKLVEVKYMVRDSLGPGLPPELTWADADQE